MVLVDVKKSNKIAQLNNWSADKEVLATNFFDNEQTIKGIKVSKGEIYNCYIGENIGHEQSNNRPVLIVSSNFFNDRTSTVTIAPLSTNIVTKIVKKSGRNRRVLKFKSQYRLHKRKFPFLIEDSVVKLDQLKTVCKSRLINKIGELDSDTLNGIKTKLTQYLDL